MGKTSYSILCYLEVIQYLSIRVLAVLPHVKYKKLSLSIYLYFLLLP
jgi:hypothetical protein